MRITLLPRSIAESSVSYFPWCFTEVVETTLYLPKNVVYYNHTKWIGGDMVGFARLMPSINERGNLLLKNVRSIFVYPCCQALEIWSTYIFILVEPIRSAILYLN